MQEATPRKRPLRLTGNALAEMGQRAGYLTAQARATALGISRSHLLHIERGAVYPSPKVQDAMIATYNRPLEMIERAANLARERLANRMLEQSRNIE